MPMLQFAPDKLKLRNTVDYGDSAYNSHSGSARALALASYPFLSRHHGLDRGLGCLSGATYQEVALARIRSGPTIEAKLALRFRAGMGANLERRFAGC